MEKPKEPSVIILKLDELKTNDAKEITKRNTPYVYFGEDNLYPQYLVELYDSVAVHCSMLQIFRRFLIGDAYNIEGNEAATENFFMEVGNGLANTISELATSYTFFDNSYVNVVPSRGGGIGRIAVLDGSSVRTGQITDFATGVENYYWSLDWRKSTGRKNFSMPEFRIYEPKEVPAFNPNKPLRGSKNGYIWENKIFQKPTQIYYTTPRYNGAVNDLEKAARVSNLMKNMIKNGMAGNTHIHVYEDLSDIDKQERVLEGLKKRFAGDSNAGEIVLTWSTGADGKPEVNNLPANNSHEMFDFMARNINENLITANQIPPFLANIQIKVGLADSGKAIRESLSYFQNITILPYQKKIENILNTLLELNGIKSKISLVESTPFSFLSSDDMIKHSMTVREYRERILQLEEDFKVEDLMINATKTATDGTN